MTGRLLVGLRWWNEVKEDGSNVWIFESKPASRVIHPSDSFIFWSSLYATPAIWILLGIGEMLRFKFHWLLIVAVAVTLAGANVVGYWKCQKGNRQNTINSHTTGMEILNVLTTCIF